MKRRFLVALATLVALSLGAVVSFAPCRAEELVVQPPPPSTSADAPLGSTSAVTHTIFLPIIRAAPRVLKGVGIGWDHGDPAAIQQLNVAWTHNWGMTPGRFGQGPQYIPMLWCSIPSEALIAEVASLNTSHIYLVFNEPDSAWQCDITPEMGAQRYHDFRELVFKYDPQAKFIVGGVIANGGDNTNVPGGEAWLTAFIQAYQELYGTPPPVDGWHFHIYPECRVLQDGCKLSTFVRDANVFYSWYQIHGGGKEVWLTEYGCAATHDQAILEAFMRDTRNWLQTVGVNWIKRSAWFATDTGVYTGALLTGESWDILTDLGWVYSSLP